MHKDFFVPGDSPWPPHNEQYLLKSLHELLHEFLYQHILAPCLYANDASFQELAGQFPDHSAASVTSKSCVLNLRFKPWVRLCDGTKLLRASSGKDPAKSTTFDS